MVARVLFLVLPCGETRSHPQHRATIKDFAGECEKYAMVPVHRATARDRPYYRRPSKPTHPCIVGAGLAPALPPCTRSFIRQQGLKAHPSPHHPPSPLQNPRLALTHQFALFCLSDGSVITDALLLSRAEMNLLDCCASPLIIRFGANEQIKAAIMWSCQVRLNMDDIVREAL